MREECSVKKGRKVKITIGEKCVRRFQMIYLNRAESDEWFFAEDMNLHSEQIWGFVVNILLFLGFGTQLKS